MQGSIRSWGVILVAVAVASVLGFGFRAANNMDPAVADLTGLVVADPTGIGTLIDVRMGSLASGGSVRLLRAGVPDGVNRGHDLALALVFAVDEPLDVDWTVFVHIEREGYRLNADHPPAAGRHPTSAWQRGQFVVDTVSKSVPLEAPAGRYEIWVGLYRGNERLPLVGAGTATDGADRLRVGVLEVL